jgi:hypothetical protein
VRRRIDFAPELPEKDRRHRPDGFRPAIKNGCGSIGPHPSVESIRLNQLHEFFFQGL